MAVPAVVREHYLKAIGALIERYKRELGARGIDYQLLTTDAAARARAAGVSVDAGAGVSDGCRSCRRCSCSARWRPRCRSCCTCSSGSRKRASSLRPCGCCGARRSSTPTGGTCASCCCWRCASRRCCCWRSRSPARSSRRAARSASAGVTVVALDTSLSLSAPGQFDAREQLAQRGRSPAPAGDLVGVVTFADGAAVAARPSADRALALAAVDGAGAGFGATRYRAALNAAAELLDGRRGTHRRRHRSAGERLGCRRPRPRFRSRPRSRSPTSARRRRIWRSIARSRVGDRIVATVRNAGPRRARRARSAHDRRRVPPGEALVPVAAGQTARRRRCRRRAGATRHRVGRRSRRRARRQRAVSRARRREPPAGARRDRRPAISAATRSTCSRRSRRRAGAARSYRGRRAWRRRSCRRGMAAGSLDQLAAVVLLSTRGLERRGRELLAAYVQSGGGVLVAAGAGRRRRGRGRHRSAARHARRSPTGSATRTRDGRGARAGRHPASGVSRRSAAGAATLGLATFRRDRERSCGTAVRRWRGSRPAKRRCSIARRATDGRSCFASDLDNRVERFPAARDVRARSCTRRRAIWPARGRARPITWSATSRPASPAAPGHSLELTAAAGAGRPPRGRERRSGRVRSGTSDRRRSSRPP